MIYNTEDKVNAIWLFFRGFFTGLFSVFIVAGINTLWYLDSLFWVIVLLIVFVIILNIIWWRIFEK